MPNMLFKLSDTRKLDDESMRLPDAYVLKDESGFWSVSSSQDNISTWVQCLMMSPSISTVLNSASIHFMSSIVHEQDADGRWTCIKNYYGNRHLPPEFTDIGSAREFASAQGWPEPAFLCCALSKEKHLDNV